MVANSASMQVYHKRVIFNCKSLRVIDIGTDEVLIAWAHTQGVYVNKMKVNENDKRFFLNVCK